VKSPTRTGKAPFRKYHTKTAYGLLRSPVGRARICTSKPNRRDSLPLSTSLAQCGAFLGPFSTGNVSPPRQLIGDATASFAKRKPRTGRIRCSTTKVRLVGEAASGSRRRFPTPKRCEARSLARRQIFIALLVGCGFSVTFRHVAPLLSERYTPLDGICHEWGRPALSAESRFRFTQEHTRVEANFRNLDDRTVGHRMQ
jgi:hypothetical protein